MGTAQIFYVIVGSPDYELIEVYRFVTENPAVAEDIEFLAGKTVGYGECEDMESQARVEKIWADHFADKCPYATGEDKKVFEISNGAKMVCMERWKPEDEPAQSQAEGQGTEVAGG